MSRLVAQVAPLTTPSGMFATTTHNPRSWLHCMNESPFFIQLDLGPNGQPVVQPWYNRLFLLREPVENVGYNVIATLGSASSSSPLDTMFVEILDPHEPVTSGLEGPVFRQANIGNSVTTNNTGVASSLEQDLISGFVFSGYTAAKDGGNPAQLDVALGIAFLKQSDGSWLRIANPSSTQNTGSLFSATLFLDLNADGTWSWALTHSPFPNAIPIASVTTDGSANILTVTDLRPTGVNLFPGAVGDSQLPGNLSIPAGKAVLAHNSAAGGGVTGKYEFIDPNNSFAYFDLNADHLRLIGNFQGGGSFEQLNVALQTKTTTLDGPLGGVAGQAAAGALGLALIVAQALRVAVAVTTQQTILSFTPSAATALYRINVRISFSNVTSPQTLLVVLGWTDPDRGAQTLNLYNTSTASPALVTASQLFEASSGAAITLKYTDPGGTPADKVTVVLERLS